MKKVCPEKTEEEDTGVPATTIREISLLRSHPHPNIVQLRDVTDVRKNMYLVFEFLDLNLDQYIRRVRSNGLSPTLIKSYLHQVLSAIAHLHSFRILHRDIKPQNLLVDKHGTIKVADLGLGRSSNSNEKPLTPGVATLWYRAPELLLGGTFYSLPIDIWAVGCLFAEMLQSHPLFTGDTEIAQLVQIFKQLGTPNESSFPGIAALPGFQVVFPDFPTLPMSTILSTVRDPLALDLVEKMLRYDPQARISAQEALDHPYFNNLRTIVRLQRDDAGRVVGRSDRTSSRTDKASSFISLDSPRSTTPVQLHQVKRKRKSTPINPFDPKQIQDARERSTSRKKRSKAIIAVA